ncbi:MAG: Na(+)-translocating NADH-quinone reductase subunit C [bacterium]|nr:Na(+)-translocating NADH-quinone reductase subunit C [bacterium]
MQHSTGYIIGFAAAVCLVASLFVAGSAVGLKDLQEANKRLDVQKKVLTVAGLMDADAGLSADEVNALYTESIQPKAIDLKTGAPAPSVDVASYDQRKATKGDGTSFVAPENASKILRLPNEVVVFDIVQDGELKGLILPIEGYGLWGFLYGYLALEPDARTIRGITFYDHGETPGLGGEVDNPRWKALWPGRLAFDDRGKPAITVKKGIAGSVENDPYQVDGLSGATITSRGVTNLVRFWLGDDGFGPYLDKYRESAG